MEFSKVKSLASQFASKSKMAASSAASAMHSKASEISERSVVWKEMASEISADLNLKMKRGIESATKTEIYEKSTAYLNSLASFDRNSLPSSLNNTRKGTVIFSLLCLCSMFSL